MITCRARRAITALVVGAMASAMVVLVGPPAQAVDQPPKVQQRTPTTVTADELPTVQIETTRNAQGNPVKGYVNSQDILGTTVYAGGYFDNTRPAGAQPGSNLTPRSNLLAYNLTTGNLIGSFAPQVNGEVKVVKVSPDGSRLYIGGSFNQVDGQTRWNIAAFDTATGQLLSSFRPAVGGSFVNAIEVTDDAVYVGGLVAAGNGQPRQNLMAFSLTGSLLGWAPTADLQVDAMTLTPTADKLIIAGRFAEVNGASQRGLAALDLVDGSLIPWAITDTIKNGWNEGSSAGRAGIISLHTDDSAIYGTGWVYANKTVGNLEGTFSADPDTGEIIWLADCHGDTVDVYSDNTTVYTVGHNHDCQTVGSFPEVSPREWWHGAAYTVEPTGLLSRGIVNNIYADWSGYPGPSPINWWPDNWTSGSIIPGNTATNVTGSGDYIVVGGDFIRMNERWQQGLVRFANPNATTPSDGPRLSGDDWTPSAISIVPETVRVSIPENWDRDDLDITYELYRQGESDPVDSQMQPSVFWQSEIVVLTETGLTPGSNQSYRVAAVDGDGNTAYSAWVDVTVSDGTVSDYALGVLEDAALIYWPFQETSGSVAADWTGTSNGQISSGVTLGVPGAIAQDDSRAFGFNGTSSGLVASQSTFPGPQVFSIEAWFRTTTDAGGKIIGFGNRSSGNSNNYDRHIYMRNDGRVTFGVYPGGVRTVTSDDPFNDGEWHHVVATLGPDGMALFVDGVEVGRDVSVTSAQSYSGHWRVGGDNLNGWTSRPSSDYLDADIDDVAVYGVVLGDTEIASHHQVGLGIAPNQAPTAAFTATVSDLTVELDATASTDPDGVVVAYAWDFDNDGTVDETTDQPTTSHTYPAAGDYTISLTVTDNDDTPSDPTTQNVTVTVPASTVEVPVVADTMVHELSPTSTYGSRTFLTLRGAPGLHGYLRVPLPSLEPGQVVTGARLQLHTLDSPSAGSTEPVTVQVASNDWDEATVTWDTRPTVDGPVLGTWAGGISPDTSYEIDLSAAGVHGLAGGEVTLALIAGQDVAQIHSRETSNPDHHPTLILDLGPEAELVPTNEAPVAEFTADVTDLTVDLDASASTDPDGVVVGYAWDFDNDGTVDETTDQPTTSHTYPAAGDYTISLTVTDNDDTPSDPATAPVTVTEPPVAVDTTFTFAVIPDTQAEALSDDDPSMPERVSWLVEDRDALDLRWVLHTGDVHNWDTPDHDQYERMSTWLQPLGNAGIPYILSVGNHDTGVVCEGGGACPDKDPLVAVRDTSTWNMYYPPSRFGFEALFESEKSDNGWRTFQAGGLDWLVLSLEIWPRSEVIDWAEQVVADHANHNVIVTTHAFLDKDGAVSTSNGGYGANSPATLWDALDDYPNVMMVFSGHTREGTAANTVENAVDGHQVGMFLTVFHDDDRYNPTRLVTVDTEAGTVSTRIVANWDRVNDVSTDFEYTDFTETISGFDFR